MIPGSNRDPGRRSRLCKVTSAEHVNLLEEAGASVVEVRHASDLDHIDAIVIPGGESTTIGRLATIFGLLEPLEKAIARRAPAFGSCAGMILLARALPATPSPSWV